MNLVFRSCSFANASEPGFDCEDLEQDIDGINLGLILQNNVEAYNAIQSYYLNDNTYKNRIGTVLTEYFKLLSTNQESQLANIAESYTNLEKATAAALAGQLGGYNVELLSDKLSSQFAKKLIDMYNEEISD